MSPVSGAPTALPSRTPIHFDPDNCGGNRTDCTIYVGGSDPSRVRCRNFPLGSDFGQCWCRPDRFQCSSGNPDFACTAPRAVCVRRTLPPAASPAPPADGPVSLIVLVNFDGDLAAMPVPAQTAFVGQVFDAVNTRAVRLLAITYYPDGLDPAFAQVALQAGSIQAAMTFAPGSRMTEPMARLLAADIAANPISVLLPNINPSAYTSRAASVHRQTAGPTAAPGLQTTPAGATSDAGTTTAPPPSQLGSAGADNSTSTNDIILYAAIGLCAVLVVVLGTKCARQSMKTATADMGPGDSGDLNGTYSSSHSVHSRGSMQLAPGGAMMPPQLLPVPALPPPPQPVYSVVTNRGASTIHNQAYTALAPPPPPGLHYATPGPGWLPHHHSDLVGRNSRSALSAMTGGGFGGRLWANSGLNTTIAPHVAGAPTAPSFLDRSLSAFDSPVRSRWQ